MSEVAIVVGAAGGIGGGIADHLLDYEVLLAPTTEYPTASTEMR